MMFVKFSAISLQNTVDMLSMLLQYFENTVPTRIACTQLTRVCVSLIDLTVSTTSLSCAVAVTTSPPKMSTDLSEQHRAHDVKQNLLCKRLN